FLRYIACCFPSFFYLMFAFLCGACISSYSVIYLYAYVSQNRLAAPCVRTWHLDCRCTYQFSDSVSYGAMVSCSHCLGDTQARGELARAYVVQFSKIPSNYSVRRLLVCCVQIV